MLWTPIEEIIKRRNESKWSRSVSSGLVAGDIATVHPTGSDGRRQLIITTGNPSHQESKIWDIDEMNLRELEELREWMSIHMPNKLASYYHGAVEAEVEFIDASGAMAHFKESAKRWYRNDPTPVEVCYEAWNYALEVMPPAAMLAGGFLMGEEYSRTCYGQPVYHGFFIKEGKRWLITGTEHQWRTSISAPSGSVAASP